MGRAALGPSGSEEAAWSIACRRGGGGGAALTSRAQGSAQHATQHAARRTPHAAHSGPELGSPSEPLGLGLGRHCSGWETPLMVYKEQPGMCKGPVAGVSGEC